MLLFFIAQMAAWAGSCDAENTNTMDMSYKIYICNIGINEEVDFAVNFWNNMGQDLTIAPGEYNCTNFHPDKGEIYIEFDNEKTKAHDTDTTSTNAVTSITKFIANDTVSNSKIYLSTKLLIDRKKFAFVILHEIGHAVGYEHVSEDCQDYIMNPYYKTMGIKL